MLREYVDIGESGAKDSRPQLNELTAAARKRQVDVVLVWRFDRFARSTKHLLLALEELCFSEQRHSDQGMVWLKAYLLWEPTFRPTLSSPAAPHELPAIVAH